MSNGNFLFTSESVSEGHPDKICDLISDHLVDLFLKEDPESRTAIECLATTNHITIAGEVRGPASITKERIIQTALDVVKDIGYEQAGFDWRTIDFNYRLHAQSQDIAQGVDSSSDKDEGAGDQGIMFGYACIETDDYMPAPIYYAHKILKELAAARKDGNASFLEPDAKCQLTLQYENFMPIRANSIVLSTQHSEDASQEMLQDYIKKHIAENLPHDWMCEDKNIYINPTGRFVIGGPDGDTGLTGRKIIVDTYGGAAPHGGGAFSGKDPTKVDRSATYMARYLAKNVVAAGLAKRCLIQLCYAIGVSKPLAVYVDTFGTGKISEYKIAQKLQELVDLSPRGIREHLQLNRPIYAQTAAYGHFGHRPQPDGGYSWEKVDLVDRLG
jgi:S-adenosylmethionine synthetase